MKRAREVWKMSSVTVLILSGVFTLAGELFPTAIVKVFMAPTAEALQAAPRIMRLSFPVFLFLGVTILSDYYLQSVMRDKESLLIGIMHSVLLSGIMCLVLPSILGINGLWMALPVTEAIIAMAGCGFVKRE